VNGQPDDPFSMLELLIGLPNVRVLSVDRVAGVLEIHLETAEPNRFCKLCGLAGLAKDPSPTDSSASSTAASDSTPSTTSTPSERNGGTDDRPQPTKHS
jgi:hypothetical protein